jgi:hypothetical protein
MKKTKSTMTGPARVIKKLNLCKEHIRVLTLTDLKPVEGGSGVPGCNSPRPSCQLLHDDS